MDELELLVEELADPRLDYLLGALPVLPLPDASVDRSSAAMTAIRRSNGCSGRMAAVPAG